MTFRTFDVAGVRDVHVDWGAGSITLDEGSRSDVVEGSINAGTGGDLDDIAIRRDADQLRISVPLRLRLQPVQLRLGVPPGLNYGLRTSSAVISCSVQVDRAKISTGSGDVSVEQARELDVSTGSGTISVGRLVGRGGRLHTGSGAISVAEAGCPVSAKSGSGDIVIRSLQSADLVASSGAGDIAVPSTSGSVDLRSAAGSLTVGVADDLPVWLDLHSVSGAVRIALEASHEPGPGEPFVSVRARTASGEIAVYRA